MHIFIFYRCDWTAASGFHRIYCGKIDFKGETSLHLRLADRGNDAWSPCSESAEQFDAGFCLV